MGTAVRLLSCCHPPILPLTAAGCATLRVLADRRPGGDACRPRRADGGTVWRNGGGRKEDGRGRGCRACSNGRWMGRTAARLACVAPPHLASLLAALLPRCRLCCLSSRLHIQSEDAAACSKDAGSDDECMLEQLKQAVQVRQVGQASAWGGRPACVAQHMVKRWPPKHACQQFDLLSMNSAPNLIAAATHAATATGREGGHRD